MAAVIEKGGLKKLSSLILYAQPLRWPGVEIRRVFLSGVGAAASPGVFFPLLFFLAPRARIAIGWCF